MSNSIKHGKAKEIDVRFFKNASELCLEVRDHGIGFEPKRASCGLGLVGMQERVRMVGGALTVIAAPGRGALIRAVVPNHGTRSGDIDHHAA